MPIRRKCIYCHNYIDVQKDVGTYIYQNNGAISHIECFSNYKKSLKVPWSQRKINEYIGFAQKQTKSSMEELIKEEQKKKAKKESKQAAGERSSSARRILTDWLLERYNITMPKAFFVRLDSVYKGTYRGLAQPIPPEHLLFYFPQIVFKANLVLRFFKTISNYFVLTLALVSMIKPIWTPRKREHHLAVLIFAEMFFQVNLNFDNL